MDAVKFLEEYNRMCNTYDNCVGCSMYDKPFCHPHDMTTNDERKELVDAVEKWSCEHPMVTNEMSDTISRAAAIDAIDRAVTKEAARWSLQGLPSAQPEPCEDTISRRAVINALHGYFDGMLETDTWSPCDVYGLIEILPSAQPEQKKGEWINRSLNILYPESERYTCSVCGKHSYSYDFCPHCGSYNGGGQSD